MVDLYAISVLVFIALFGFVIYRDRKNLEFKYIMLIRKTKKCRDYIEAIARWHPRFWKIFSTLGVLVAIIAMAVGIFLFLMISGMILSKSIKEPSLGIVLPVAGPNPEIGPGFIFVPFWFWIVLLPFILIPHEFSHAIIARVEKVRLKHVGLFLLLFLPGAFVEPDEKDMKKASTLSRLRIVSMGTVMNFASVAVVFAFAYLLLWPVTVNSGVLITGVEKNSTAYAAGLREGMQIEGFGGYSTDVSFLDYEGVYGYLLTKGALNETSLKLSTEYLIATRINSVWSNYKPGDMLQMRADGSDYKIVLAKNPKNSTQPYIGVSVKPSVKINSEDMYTVGFPLLWWLTNVPLWVAVINILPIYPLDGGLIVEYLAERVTKKHKKIIVSLATLLMLGLIMFNIVGPLIVPLIV
jgi:membrane-associated protease RseP (regulator of RpoE activity)